MRLLKILYIFLCSALFIACGDDDENSNLGDWERVDCPFAVSAILDFGNYIHVVRTDGVLFLYDGKNFEQTNVRMDLEGKYASVFPEYGVNIFKTSNKLFILGEDSYYVRSNDSKDFKKSFPIPSDSENIVCCAGKVFTYSFGRVYNHTSDKWEDITELKMYNENSRSWTSVANESKLFYALYTDDKYLYGAELYYDEGYNRYTGKILVSKDGGKTFVDMPQLPSNNYNTYIDCHSTNGYLFVKRDKDSYYKEIYVYDSKVNKWTLVNLGTSEIEFSARFQAWNGKAYIDKATMPSTGFISSDGKSWHETDVEYITDIGEQYIYNTFVRTSDNCFLRCKITW